MVLASIFVSTVAISSYGMLGQTIGSGANIDSRVSIGTFRLLNKAIADADPQQRESIVARYKKIFGKEFQLLDLPDKRFSKAQLNDLNDGKVVVIQEDIISKNESVNEDLVYFKVPDKNLVWRTDLNIDVNQEINETGVSLVISNGTFSEGIFYLLEEQLKGKPESSWAAIIAELQKIHEIPLSIKPITSLQAIKSNDLKGINEGQIINISPKEKDVTFVHRVFESDKVIQLGPVEIPWYMRNFLYATILSFVLSFASMLLLWIYPLWSNLKKLQKAADRFGAGDYNTRIPFNFFSPIGKISQAFNAMAERTQRSIQNQKELTSAVSHELRTPVARMRFALEMLEDLNRSDTNDKDHIKASKSRFINDINTDINELDMLLEELLTYARLDHDKAEVKLGTVKLAAWFTNAMQRLEPLAGDKTLHYTIQEISENDTAQIEPRLMSRVLDNLVQNAIRYAKTRINVSLCKENGDFLLVVEDDGKGIPKSKQEHIFEAFSRIDESRDRASGGFGLGLAIANRIVKNHKGTISLHDLHLGGACFIVRVPMR